MTPAAPVTSFGPNPSKRPARTRPGRLLERAVSPVLPALYVLAAVLVLAGSLLLTTPGTTLTTTTRPGPSRYVRAPGATLFIVGQSERGSTTQPIEVTSILSTRSKLGNRVTYGLLDDNLSTWYAEGGGRAYVARVVGAGAAAGFLSLVDRAVAPVATLKISANSAGAWSTSITVQVLDGSLANTFRLQIRYAGELVEDWNNLTSPANAVQVLNPSSNNPGSQYVVATDLASVTVAPTNNPAVLAATALSAGTDDRGTIAAQNYIDALARFGPALGDGIVIIPGQAASAVYTGMKTHCQANNRLGLVAPASGQTLAQAKAAAIALRGQGAFQEGMGFVWPHVYMPDGAGGRRLISPEAYAAACRARAHDLEGPWRAPAGDIATAQFILDVETELTAADMEDATREHIIPVMKFPGIGIQLYGWRSLSTDEANYMLLTGRDVLNRLSVAIKARTDRLVFGTIDGERKFLGKLEAEIRAEVKPMATAGGLFPMSNAAGEQTDPGYVIDTGPGVNTAATLALNQALADVGARISPTGETIRVTLAKVGIGTAL